MAKVLAHRASTWGVRVALPEATVVAHESLQINHSDEMKTASAQVLVPELLLRLGSRPALLRLRHFEQAHGM